METLEYKLFAEWIKGSATWCRDHRTKDKWQKLRIYIM